MCLDFSYCLISALGKRDGYGSPFRKLSDSSFMLFYTFLSRHNRRPNTSPCLLRSFSSSNLQAAGIMHSADVGIIRKYDLIAFSTFSMLLVAVKVSSRFFVQRASSILVALLVGLSFHNLSPAPCFICSFSSRCYVGEGQ